MNLPEESEQIEKAAQVLKNGGVVIFPTDTVFGIGCLFDEPEAIVKISKIKNRPVNMKMPILVSDKDELVKLGCIVNDPAADIIDKYWPGALTLVLPATLGTIGVRMPNHPATLKLLKLAGKPIIGTSANYHSHKPVKNSRDLDPDIVKKVDFVVEGKSTLGKESTVVDCTSSEIRVLREGAVQIKL
ncbi:MAG TPA: L-threonylcarbamoyladenylate synthase [Patescibacteria group bacterium]